MKDLALVVFDMAGTTIEDSGQVPAAFTAALRKHGIEINDDALRAVRGASKRDAIRHFVVRQDSKSPDVELHTDMIYADFRACLSQLFRSGGVKPIAGAADAFAWLRDHGVKVALNTGFDRMIANLVIDAVGWNNGVVDTVLCGDDVPQGRPAPYLIFRSMEQTGVTSVHRVMSVGDTVLDLRAGKNAGVRYVVGVLSGAHGREQLEKESHTYLIASVAALPALLQ